jgi:hypothetical protein
MTDNNSIAEKPYRITIERVAKGYVRWTVRADGVDDAMYLWDTIKDNLKRRKEMIEGDEPRIEEG